MFKKVRPYMGGYIKYTRAAVTVMLIGIIASVVPYFFVYRISVSFRSKKHRKNDTKRRKYDIIGARKITAWY